MNEKSFTNQRRLSVEKKEYNCPYCKDKLIDSRDQDDRIDFWCETCRTAFHADLVEGKNDASNM